MGEATPTGTVVVSAEQGFGDTLQFVRWIRAVRALARRVVLQVPAPLVRLLSLANLADVVEPLGAPTNASDLHVPLLSIPHRLGWSTDAQVFGGGAPLLRAPDEGPALAERPPGTRRIGIVWSGSPTHVNDMHRSVPIAALEPLFAIPDIEWVALQPGTGQALAQVAPRALDAASRCTDFADTAFVMQQLDAVVTVDTAAAHLAAGLGVPTHLLLPAVGVDWRWGHEGQTTPWYDTAVVHRATPAAGWPALIKDVAALLATPVPNEAVVWNNRCVAARNARSFGEALQAGRRASVLAPTSPDVWVNLANALVAAGQEAEGARASARAVTLAPKDSAIVAAHARTLERANQLDEACALFDQLIETATDDAQLRYNRGLAHLKAGRWEQGWRDYEARWALPQFREWRRSWPSIPEWQREPLASRHLLVRHEQGAGDTIMASRWIPDMIVSAARVTLQVPRALVSLFAHQWPSVDVVAADERVDADYIVPMLSLPYRSGLRTPFANGAAYLRAPRPLAETAPALAAQLTSDPRPKVGIVWAGTPEHPYDHLRSRPLETFAPLLADPSVAVVSLQVGAGAEQWGASPHVRQARGAIDASPALRDYAATAAVIAALDRVVSVDTSVAHLSGALGVPTTILLPRSADWRWGVSGSHTGWYASATLLRPR